MLIFTNSLSQVRLLSHSGSAVFEHARWGLLPYLALRFGRSSLLLAPDESTREDASGAGPGTVGMYLVPIEGQNTKP